MKVLVLTANQWQTLHDFLKGKNMSWFKDDAGSVDLNSTSRTTATSPTIDGMPTANKYVVNLDKLDRTALKGTQAWADHKEQIKARIFDVEQIEIDRDIG